jgi:hypothetical protein
MYFFAGSKARCAFNIKRSSRKTLWTGDWRKAHKKDTSKIIKKRTKHKTIRYQKDIVGLTLEEIRKQRAAKVIERGRIDPALKLLLLLLLYVYMYYINIINRRK